MTTVLLEAPSGGMPTIASPTKGAPVRIVRHDRPSSAGRVDAGGRQRLFCRGGVFAGGGAGIAGAAACRARRRAGSGGAATAGAARPGGFRRAGRDYAHQPGHLRDRRAAFRTTVSSAAELAARRAGGAGGAQPGHCFGVRLPDGAPCRFRGTGSQDNFAGARGPRIVADCATFLLVSDDVSLGGGIAGGAEPESGALAWGDGARGGAHRGAFLGGTAGANPAGGGARSFGAGRRAGDSGGAGTAA